MGAGPPILPLDPAALASFRREGAAIIAQERGLTPACRIRLVQAATSAGIAADRVEEAIRSLSAAEPTAPPSAAAEHFRQRLRKDLTAKTRPIVGPTMESKILAAAERKFGLSETLAAQILAEVATELGLTRITATDAIRSLTAQIDQAAESSTWLAREAWDRLRSAGAKWGLELELIDALIEERLAANRTDRQRRQFWTKTTLVATAAAVMTASLVLAGLTIARMRTAESARPSIDRAPSYDPAPEPVLTTPRWWDVPLSVDMATTRGRKDAPAEVLTAISSPRADDRAPGYERLVEHAARVAKPDQRDDLARLIAACLALETDDSAAQRLQTALALYLPNPAGLLAADDQVIERSFFAARTFGLAIDRAGISDDRKSDVSRILTDAIGAPRTLTTTKDDRQREIRQRVILAWYVQLASIAGKEPRAAAKTYPEVFAAAERILGEDEHLDAEAAFLVAALPTAGEHWLTYKRSLDRLISSPNPLQPLRLVEVLRRATDSALVEHLSRLLIVRSGAEPRTAARKDVILAVRKALAGDGGGLTIADRWLILEDEVTAALATRSSTSQEQILAQTIHLAHLTTLAIALAQGEAGLATFDARIDEPPTLEPARESSSTPAESKPAASPLSKPQQRELNDCLDDLGKTNAAARPAREAAWRRLALLAKDVSDIPPAAAAQIANQAVAPQENSDFARRLPLLRQLRDWKHVRLAISDKLLTSRLAADQQRSLVETLTDHEPDAAATASELRRLLLTGVLEELPTSAGAAIHGELLDAAQTHLSEIYFERARLLGVAPGTISTSHSPAQLAEHCLLKLASNPASTQPKRTAAQFVTGVSDIRHLAALQTLLIEASSERLASRRPDRALAARRLTTELRSATSRVPDVLAQLRDQEQRLLELWMLHAPDA
jgi:hypothetical protein